MTPLLDTLARIAAERALNSVVAGVLLTLLAWALLRLIPRTNARTRVAVWTSLLLAVPTLSLASVLLPHSDALASQSARIVVPEGWATAIFAAWGTFAAFALMRVAFGLWRIYRMRKDCRPLGIRELAPDVGATIDQYRPARPVALLISESARVPMAIGFIRPAVILPSWALAELSSGELSAVLIHEFTHLRRWDDWTNFLQKILHALFFFHPSLWWLDRQLALDREIACDDEVLAATNKAHDYARCLVDLAEKSLVRRSLALAQAAVHRTHHISLRITRILDSTRPRTSRVSKLALAGATGLAGICLIAVLQSPTLIAFQNPAMADSGIATVTAAVDRGRVSASSSEKVVPVVLRERVNHDSFSLTKKKPSRAATRPKSPDVVLPAKFVPHSSSHPQVLRAGLAIHPQAVIPVESIFFVMPDARFDSTGRVVWTFSVWRLTVFHPAQEATLSNSI